jgi:nitrogen fixation protein NifU and related proteins
MSEMTYNEMVLEHFTNPRNVGEMENPDGEGMMVSKTCGDMMKVQIRVEDGIISDIKFKTFGCGAAIASSSMATEMVKGKSVEEALKITNKNVLDALGGLPAAKVHCSLLAEQAIRMALDNYMEKHPQEQKTAP